MSIETLFPFPSSSAQSAAAPSAEAPWSAACEPWSAVLSYRAIILTDVTLADSKPKATRVANLVLMCKDFVSKLLLLSQSVRPLINNFCPISNDFLTELGLIDSS